MMTWLIIATVFYVVVNAIIGFWKMRADSFESFVGYRNQAPWWLLILSINGTFIGGGMFFATGEMAYKAGWVPMVLAIATAAGLLGLGFLSSRIRKIANDTNSLTLYDIIQTRFGTGANVFLGAVATMNIILYFFLLAGQFLALTTFLQAFGGVKYHIGLALAIGIVFLNTLVYSVVGGLKKDIWTDFFQMIIITIASAVLIIAILGPNQWQTLSTLPPPVAPEQFGIVFIIGTILFFTPAFLVRYDLWQRVLAAKNDRAARLASFFSIPIVVSAYALFTLCGNYGRIFAGDADGGRFAMFATMEHILGPGAFIAVALGLYAAVMSSADTFLNITAISLHRIATGTAQNADSRQSLLQLRVLTTAVCLAAGALVLLSPSIVELMVGAFSSLVISVPGVLYSLLAKQPKPKPATASILSGLLVFLILFLAVPSIRTTAFVLATLTAAGVLLAGILVTRNRT